MNNKFSTTLLSLLLMINVKAQFNCGDNFTDPRDGQIYPTVQIGSQCWMAKNMNRGVFIAEEYPTIMQANNGIIEKFCDSSDSSYCATYCSIA